jgi:hypothetical protein
VGVLVIVGVLLGVKVDVNVRVLVGVRVIVGVLVIVGVDVAVNVGVGVRVIVGHAGWVKETRRPELMMPRLHSYNVYCEPVPRCIPTVALLPL